MKILYALCALLIVGGCDLRGQLPPSSIAPVCRALGDPIKYSSTNKMSARYAAWLLASTLAERNYVGHELRCPGY